jgi:GNAT superfamily N-acetyltransferase
MSVTIKPCTVAEIERNPHFLALAKEYASEAAIHGLPAPVEKLAAYRLIEASGCFQGYGAFLDNDKLIGFVAVLTPVIPHYGVAIAVSESFFVAAAHRKGGAGIKLLRAAERHARQAGSPGLLVSAPHGGRLARVLPHLGYRETNRVFFKEMADA